MGIGKQAKILNKSQIDVVRSYLRSGRNGIRNELMFLLSIKAGLRSKEIASLKWIYVLNPDNTISDTINLPNVASKGNSGREIPINKDLKVVLNDLYTKSNKGKKFDPTNDFVITTERSKSTSAQSVVNFFHSTYKRLGLTGCSSHSGRRTFITNVARKISTVGGSMRDVQMLAGHSTLQTTQRYVEGSSESKIKVVNLI
jgi:integrase/recombinase XerD